MTKRRRPAWYRRRLAQAKANGEACVYCGQDDPAQITLDHVHELQSGGDDHPANIVVACRSCNSRKGLATRRRRERGGRARARRGGVRFVRTPPSPPPSSSPPSPD